MGKIVERIKSGELLVSDGAWGTFLHEKGLKASECPELWNLDRRAEVLEIAQSYVNAGSDIILTNSFGGSPFKLESYGLGARTFEINKAAAEISREAAGNQVLVLGSIGPTGKMVFMGEVTEEDLFEGFKEQVRGLIAGGADGIIMETMSDLQEARIAIAAAKSVTNLDIGCTFTFSPTADHEYKTMMGTGIAEYLDMVQGAGADLVGANCGNGTAGMIEIVKQIRRIDTEIPILVHANAGLPIYKDGETVFPESPVEMVSQMKDLVAAGANIIGGCCGTTPDHISMISNLVKEM